VWTRRCRENSQPLPELEPPIIQLVAQRCTAELSWLPFSVYVKVKLIKDDIVNDMRT
jgi:hypothetical protein